MSFHPYLSISASAGSGKTFRLSHRVLQLLAMGVSPDSFGAYTFSRKAAGEIFDSVVGCLTEAAMDADCARRTSVQMEVEHSREGFLRDLRELLRHLHRLRIGTLDSRISQMLAAVSVELGLPPEFSLMETQSAEYRRLQARVLHSLFGSGALSEADRDLFFQLFIEATHGQSEKRFYPLVESFLSAHRSVFLLTPQRNAWSGIELDDQPRALPASEASSIADQLCAVLSTLGLSDPASEKFEATIRAMGAFGPGSTWTGDLPSDTLARAVLAGEGPEFCYRRKKFRLTEEMWADLQALLAHVRGVALDQARSRTLALYGFLVAYEKAYRQQALPTGSLSFEDACHLMADFDLLAPAELAFRLDGEIDHWLLDEFQDTNRLQWHVLRPFITEVLQDPEQRRSFFYVGDVKQAIYGWRGGDSTLFDDIQRDWPAITSESMSASWRSAPEVLDLVNRVLDQVPEIDGLPPAAFQRWNEAFELHRAARENLEGHAEVWELLDKDQDLRKLLIDRVNALPAHFETAILVRSNAEGAEMAEWLREEGFSVSLEGSAALRDDTAVEVLLAGLRQAAHPRDAFSRNLCRLGGLEADGFETLERVNRLGIHPVLREWAAQLPYREPAAFSRARVARLLETALAFDQWGDPSIDRFLAHVDSIHLQEAGERGGIRIMTIHQSKGLGFDAVILPLSSSSSFVKSKGEVWVASAPDDPDSQVMQLPPRAVCDAIPELRLLSDEQRAAEVYESLCVLYVALTRAKTSLQVLLPPAPKSGGSPTVLSNWFRQRLSDEEDGEHRAGARRIWCAGADNAFAAPLAPAAERQFPEPLAFPLHPGNAILPRLEPSREGEEAKDAGACFQYTARDGRQLGSRVHALLETLSWSESAEIDSFLEAQGEASDSGVAAHIKKAWESGALCEPDGLKSLWRERKFETILDDEWITGVFDRVLLFEDHAVIQDFKTNRRDDEETVEAYRPQMRLYRRVLAHLLQWPTESVQCELLFTRSGKRVKVF